MTLICCLPILLCYRFDHSKIMDPSRSFLGDEETLEKQRALRAVVVNKSISYFREKNNRSVSETGLFNRRKNLASHLGVDESVEKKDVDKINMAILPFPSSVPKCVNR